MTFFLSLKFIREFVILKDQNEDFTQKKKTHDYHILFRNSLILQKSACAMAPSSLNGVPPL